MLSEKQITALKTNLIGSNWSIDKMMGNLGIIGDAWKACDPLYNAGLRFCFECNEWYDANDDHDCGEE